MRFLGAVAGFVVGMVTGMLVAFAGYHVWTGWLGGFDREGAAGMAAFFVYGPAIGLVLGLVLAVVFWRRLS